jgi:hypothetical protein
MVSMLESPDRNIETVYSEPALVCLGEGQHQGSLVEHVAETRTSTSNRPARVLNSLYIGSSWKKCASADFRGFLTVFPVAAQHFQKRT